MKRLKIWLMILAVLLLAGCRGKETPLEEGEALYQVYYLNAAMNRLAPWEYRIREEDTDLLIQDESVYEITGRFGFTGGPVREGSL